MSAVTGEENQQENQQGEWNQELSPDDEWYYDDLTWDESDRNSEWIGSVDDWSGDWSWYDDDWSSWPEDWSWNTQDWWTPEAQVSSNGAASSGANVLQDIAKNQPPQKVSAVRSVTNADSECPDHGTEPTRFDDSLVEFHMQVGQTEALYRREWNETTGPLLSVLLPDTRAEGLTACRFGHPDLRCNGPASSLRTRMSSLAINAELNGQNNLLIESSWVTMTNRAIGGGLECDCSSWDEIYEDEENTANAWNGSNNRNLANVMAIAQTANAREPGAENVLRKNTDLVYGPDASPLPPGDWGDLDWGSPVLDDWGWGAPASGEWGADPVSDGGASGAQVSRKLHILGSSEVQALQLQASAKVSDLLEQLREVIQGLRSPMTVDERGHLEIRLVLMPSGQVLNATGPEEDNAISGLPADEVAWDRGFKFLVSVDTKELRGAGCKKGGARLILDEFPVATGLARSAAALRGEVS
ncbi:hypothetical protein AK812_SmicGene34636 [Symbiodinium microadriaticum]|uniref:Uncharacterized protein n=1 Tax=Symbiodinium microadriaticum TaxID=2951 RepID=A0A1Q9CNI8_SYMMI|nr:hypothetical protein AK812_SmicGene34636 [Symbiodinium microadriaticum]